MIFEDFRFNDFGDSDLVSLFERNAQAHVALGKDPDTAYADDGRELDACFLGFRRRNDDSYVLYSYVYRDKEYGFLWETFFDETQRAASGGEPRVWYDGISEGHMFRVRISMKDPKHHVILDEPFTGMNDGQVIYLGEKVPPQKEETER